MHLKNGAVLKRGEYRIEKLLGQGGFGITYMAIQSGLNRKVAIKEFFMKDLCNRDAETSHVSVPSVGSRELVEKFKAKFIKEAQMISEYRHPNIVNIHDVFEENGTAYYVMEYHDGGSLSSLDLPLSVEQASGYIRQIASALSVLHENKTMHLDIKPSNVLLDKSGNAILIDFGVSKHYDQAGHQTSSTPVGISHGYAPGEQYQQNVLSFSPATDIYALGATFYKLLTGLTPPHQSEVNENGLPPFPSFVPSGIISLIRKSMQSKRKDRPQSIEEFLGLLDAALTSPSSDKTPSDATDLEIVDAMPTENTELGPVPSPKKPSRKWLWWLVALLAAITCAAAVLFMGNHSQPAGSSEAPSSPTEADQARSDAQQYASLMEMGAEYEEKDEYLQQAKEKYSSAKELEDQWSKSKDYGSLFSKNAAVALNRVEDRLKELEKAELKNKAAEKKFNDDFKKYNDLISAADKLCDKGDESSLKSAIEKYKSAAEIESRYEDSEYSDRFNRAASTSAGRAEKRLADVQAAAKQAEEQAAAKKQAEEATKNKAAGSASLTGSHKNHEWVDLGLSVKWATCNVGASRPGDYGNHYVWGEVVSMEEGKDSTSRLYGTSKSDISGNSTYDAATANWGGDWRMPTEAEFDELSDNCTWEWTTQNGHNGYKVTSKKNGQSIFLPAAGDFNGPYEAEAHGKYWSSTPMEVTGHAYHLLGFREGDHYVAVIFSSCGFSVRPVLDY